eukprot:6734712-Alexandrium_andersonii.AAC.1
MAAMEADTHKKLKSWRSGHFKIGGASGDTDNKFVKAGHNNASASASASAPARTPAKTPGRRKNNGQDTPPHDSTPQ